MRLDDVLFEAGERERNVARNIAREMHDNIADLTEIIRSGSAIAAGNPHYVQGLRDEIGRLHEELMDLGFEYDPKSPEFIRPLTLNEVSRGQRERERRERAERARADQISSAKARQEIQATMASAQRAIRQARINRQLDPSKQFAPKPSEPESYTFGGVTIPIEKPEVNTGHYVYFKVMSGSSMPSVMVYWLNDRDADVQLLDGTQGYDSALKLRQNTLITNAGELANILTALRSRGAVQVVFGPAISKMRPDITSKVKYYIDHNMDEMVNYEVSKK